MPPKGYTSPPRGVGDELELTYTPLHELRELFDLPVRKVERGTIGGTGARCFHLFMTDGSRLSITTRQARSPSTFTAQGPLPPGLGLYQYTGELTKAECRRLTRLLHEAAEQGGSR